MQAAMTHEIYQAMKARITTMPFASAKRAYDELGWNVPAGSTFWRFDADGLGDDVDSLIQPIMTKNIWNVAERFYGFLRHYDNFDARLLAAGTNE